MIVQKENQQNSIDEYQKIDKTISNNLWDTSNIIDRILLFGVISLSLLMIFKIIIFPIVGDDFVYGSNYPLNKLFMLKNGWHPGRHISELLNIIPSQVFGKMLGITIGNNLLAIRIINNIIGIGISILFYWVSSCYIINKMIPNQKSNNIIKLFIIILLSFYITRFTALKTDGNMVVGGFFLALFAWLPFLSYYQKGFLQEWMTNNKFQTYGIMLVIYYLGTQVVDTSYFITVSLSMMLVAYIVGQKLLPNFFEKTKIFNEDQNFTLILLGTHIAYGFFCLFRNTVLAPGQIELRPKGFTFDIIEIINKIKFGPFLQDISIIVGGIIILYYIYKIIKNKIIKKEDYLYLSMCIVALFWIVILSVVGTPIDHPIWLLWLCQINIIFKLYKNNNRMIQLIVPIVLLGIFVNVFQRERANLNKPIEWYQRDRILVSYFIEAQQNKQESVVIPIEVAQKINLRVTEHQENPLRDISAWMNYHGYADKYIPITFSSNQS